MFACPATDDFFRSRIHQMIDLRHPLAVLASRMPWKAQRGRRTASCARPKMVTPNSMRGTR